jgi:hypothetical protein
VHGAAVQAHEHEAPAADVTGHGVHDGERKRHGHRGVHRVAPVPQDIHAHLARERVRSDNHGMLRSDGLDAGAEGPLSGDERSPPHRRTRRGFGAGGYPRGRTPRHRRCGLGRAEAAGAGDQDEEA